MTAGEACTLAISLTRQLSFARRDRESWRLFALKVLHEYVALTHDTAMADGTCYDRVAAQLVAERDALIAPRAARQAAA